MKITKLIENAEHHKKLYSESFFAEIFQNYIFSWTNFNIQYCLRSFVLVSLLENQFLTHSPIDSVNTAAASANKKAAAFSSFPLPRPAEAAAGRDSAFWKKPRPRLSGKSRGPRLSAGRGSTKLFEKCRIFTQISIQICVMIEKHFRNNKSMYLP